MEVFVVLGETYFNIADEYGDAHPAISQWIVGVYPDKIAADAIVEELKPLAKDVVDCNMIIRQMIDANGSEEIEHTASWESLTEAVEQLRQRDPKVSLLDYDPRDGDTVGLRYTVMPGEYKAHF